MLFYLDNSLQEVFTNPSRSYVAIQAIHRILEGWINGNHLIYADRALINYLIENRVLNGIDEINIKKLDSKLGQMGFLKSFKYYVQVVGERNCVKIIENEKKVFQVSVEFIVKSRITEQPILLVENIRDARLLEKIIFASSKLRRNNVNITYLPVCGGGGAIYDSYNEYLLRNDRLCLCISDSDKKYPSDNYGETARKLIETHNNSNCDVNHCSLCDCFVIQAREIENIIPTVILEEIINGDKNRGAFVAWVGKLEKTNPTSRLFVDLKDGFSFQKIVHSNNNDYIDYWKTVFKMELSNCNLVKTGNCQKNRRCRCIVIPGMGDHVLPNVLDSLEGLSPNKLQEASKSNPEIFMLWEQLGELLMYWFCAGSMTKV